MSSETFTQSLWARTKTDHSESEGASFMGDLMRGQGTREDYVELVSQHYFMYEALEECTDAMVADPIAGPFAMEQLRRLPALERDLEFLLGDSWRETISATPVTAAYAARIREVGTTWPGGLIAHHYTRYLGDLSGGQFIGRLMKRHFGFTDRGVEFYDFPEIADIDAFKTEYKAIIDGFDWDAAERERVTEEVVLAYRFNSDLFLELTDRKVAAAA